MDFVFYAFQRYYVNNLSCIALVLLMMNWMVEWFRAGETVESQGSQSEVETGSVG
jgi:hypothetical protein